MPPIDLKFGSKNPNPDPNQPTKEYLDQVQEFVRLHNFMEKVVGPWATQARISQIIAEDYDEYNKMETTLRSNFRTATTQTFTPRGPGQPQIGGIPNSYLGPAFKPLYKKKKNESDPLEEEGEKFMNRNITEQEVVNGKAMVRMYTAVFMEAPPGSRFKDVHQDMTTKKITIQDNDGVFWVGGGQPLRALKWFEKYKYSNDPTAGPARPIIRAFLLPADIYHQISMAAEPEPNGPKIPDSSLNVDVHAASDQWGLRGQGLKAMRENVEPGSLISYADDLSSINPSFGGQIMQTDVLRNRLGIPLDTTREMSVFLTPERFKNGTSVNAEFQSRSNFEGIADTLMSIYGVWTGNEFLVSDSWTTMTGPARLERVRNELKKYNVTIDAGVWKKVTMAGNPSRLARSSMDMLRKYNRPIL